ncbi:UNVERIFIED_CONTAM: hypothetical protein QML36_11010, partial [Aerococcus urinaeequi]
KWFLHVSASKEIDSPDETNIQRIVGIDRGLRQILTIADDTAHTTFYSGKSLMKKRRRFKKLRQSYFCVRDGNRCVLLAIITTQYLYELLFAQN